MPSGLEKFKLVNQWHEAYNMTFVYHLTVTIEYINVVIGNIYCGHLVV